MDSLSSVQFSVGVWTGGYAALNAAWRSPKGPLAIPAKDTGPPPAFDLALLGGDVGKYLIPTAMFKRHHGAISIIDSLKANFDLGVINAVPGVSIQKYETYSRLPRCDAATLEALTRSRVVYLDPATAHSRLNTNAHGSPGIVPIDRTRPPPLSNLLCEDRKGCSRIDGHFDSSSDDISESHSFHLSAYARRGP